jgi:SpoVK/Ycf46/Vps4 family AAA+-type ATPase
MKRFGYLIITAIMVSFISSCAIFSGLAKVARPMKEGAIIPDDKIAVVGRIITEPRLVQDLTWTMKSLNGKSDIIFSITDEEKLSDATDPSVSACSRIDREQYFLIPLSREKAYLNTILTMFPENRTLYIYPYLEFDPDPEDRFVYIGDIIIRFEQENDLGGKDTIVEIVDNFYQIKDQYSNHLIDSSGRPVPMTKRLCKVTSEIIDIEMIKLIVRYY